MNDWNEWSRHVLTELKRHDQNQKEIHSELKELEKSLEKKLNALHIDIITLKVKSSTWGALAGFVGGSIISAAISIFMGKHI